MSTYGLPSAKRAAGGGGPPYDPHMVTRVENVEEINRLILEQLNAMGATLGVIQNDVASTRTEVSALKDDVARVKDDVARVKDDVARVKDDVARVNDEVVLVKNDLVRVKDDVTAIKFDLGMTKADVASIKAGYSTKSDVLEVKVSLIMWVISIFAVIQVLPQIFRALGIGG
jgi:archaellum component FlaC